MIRVFLVDDHAILREGLRRILSETKDIVVAGETHSGMETLRLARDADWDVLVLDLSLPDTSGLEVLRQIHTLRPDIPVLVLSMHAEDQYAVRVMRAGAAGYVTKESAPDLLIRAIRKLRGGGKFVSENLGERLVDLVGGQGAGEPHDRLSEREFEVFLRLASGWTATEIAADLKLSVKTVSTHRTNVLSKMSMASNAEIVCYALDMGLSELLVRAPRRTLNSKSE